VYNLYQLKLSPLYKNMNNAIGPLPLQHVTVPHIMPVVELMDDHRGEVDMTSTEWLQGGILTSEDTYGLDVLIAHLDTARLITSNSGLYRETAEGLLLPSPPVLGGVGVDKRLSDALSVHTHLKLLFGARSFKGHDWREERQQRYTKFEQVLNLLSGKAEQ